MRKKFIGIIFCVMLIGMTASPAGSLKIDIGNSSGIFIDDPEMPPMPGAMQGHELDIQPSQIYDLDNKIYQKEFSSYDSNIVS